MPNADNIIMGQYRVTGDREGGTSQGDSLTGTPDDDVLVGAGGADTLVGGAGDDALYAGAVLNDFMVIAPEGAGQTSSFILSGNGSVAAYQGFGTLLIIQDMTDGDFYALPFQATPHAWFDDGVRLLITLHNDGVVEGDANGHRDVAIYNTVTGVIELVSTAADGSVAQVSSGSGSYLAALSPNGTEVVFLSSSDTLVEGDTNGCVDVFVKNLLTGQIERISVSGDGSQANGDSINTVSFSTDGRSILFVSSADNLVAGDTNGAFDALIHNRDDGSTTRVSLAFDSGQIDTGVQNASFTPDGLSVLFLSDGTNVAPGLEDPWISDGNGGFFRVHTNNLFLRDLSTGAVEQLDTRQDGGQPDGGEDPDGFVGGAEDGLISSDGRYVLFTHFAANLAAGDDNQTYDVFLKDLQTGAIIALSARDGIWANGISGLPAFTVDGDYVVFGSAATNLDPGDPKDDFTTYIVRIAGPDNARDVLSGGLGDDRYYIDSTSDVVIEAKGEGTDTAYASVSYTLGSTSYVERLTLTGWANINATGNNIANVLTGNAGVNILTGAKGDDIYYFQNTGDKAIEIKGQGTDLIYSSVSFVLGSSSYVENLTLTGSANLNGTGNGIANLIRGNSGNNTLDGGKGDDRLYGGAGNDILNGGVSGSDKMAGEAGNDTYYINSSDDRVYEDKGQGTDLVYSSVSFVLGATEYVENLTLTGSANLNGTGNGIDNLIRGNSGNNTLDGAKGDDRLYGGTGNDTLNGGGSGSDKMAGETGNDIYYVNSSGDVVYEDKGEGTDLVYSSVSFVLGATEYVENLTLTGSAHLNSTGNNIANVLTGNAGINVLTGYEGDDTYYVQNTGDTAIEVKGQGTDLVYSSVSFTLGASSYVENLTLTGSAKLNGTGNGIANVIVGNSGANRIDGLKGQDTLTGGGGADTFVFSATSHSTVTAADRITDLSNSDFIDLSAIDANTNASGTQHFSLVDAFTNTAGQVTLTFDGTYTNLRADTNGDGVADMLVRITGDHDDFTHLIIGGG